MPEPEYGVTTESMYERFPDIYRIEDAKANWVLKRFLSGMGMVMSDIEMLLKRIDYVDPSERGGHDNDEEDLVVNGVTYGLTSDLVDSRTADYAWLPWIAQVLGVTLDQKATEQDQRDLLSTPSASFSVGTKQSIKATVQAGLTGTKYCEVYDHTVSLGSIGAGTVWDMFIAVKTSEIPAGFDPVAAVIAANQKPAGVILRSGNFETAWSVIQSQYPTWAEWNNATWQEIESAGLP